MFVLALDTATPLPALAVFGDGVDEEVALPSGRQASEALLPALDRLLARCGLSLDGIGRIAVLSGPGSFTGIRVGLATAWGLSRRLRVPVETAGSLEAVAETARGGGALVRAVFGAERGQVYAAVYDLSSPRAKEVEAPHLAPEGSVAQDGIPTVRAASLLVPSPALSAARAIARSPREESAGLHAVYVRLSAAEERHGNAES
jgi:tRNA threonylcarbamoyladenosine biosynthesis protein TsaB